MPRPKGSKNKKSVAAPALDLESIKQRIDAIEHEIDELNEALKAKKTELKALTKQKAEAEVAAAAKKAEADKAAILAAVEASGKTVEEILDLLR